MDDKMIQVFEPLIKKIASKFYGVSYEDLIQAGNIGLLNAYNHYNNNSNTKFSTFAYSYIFGEMYNLVINSKVIKYNKDSLKIIKLYEKTKLYLTQVLNRIPTISEISSYLEIDEDVINNSLLQVNNILSLDDDINLYNIVGTNNDYDTKIDINDSLSTLSDDELKIIKYRYYDDLTQSEIAKVMNMSQVSVSRYEKRSLSKMYNYLNN